jgi:hypothetical protein
MLKFWEMLRPQGPFLGAAKLLSTGEGKAETDQVTNLVRPLGCFSPFNPRVIVTFP